ncbi:MAG: hypothetical protein LBQ63_03345 [Deltaproteobacteria bacterium]|jgi:hypothetical protein|nr:hypothetical protein [Deltaproteobacteria bacterium]
MHLPDFMDQREILPDPSAYEALPPQWRACLKSQIAMLHKLWLPLNPERLCLRDLPGAGSLFCEYTPRSWIIFVLAADYASPVGLIAAVLPALMAGAELILICRLKDESCPVHFPSSLSLALEFLGQECFYSLDAGELSALLENMLAQSGPESGGMVVLGDDGAGEALFLRAQRLGLASRLLPGRMRIALAGDSGRHSGAEDHLLRWLYPQAEFLPLALDPGGAYAAVFGRSASPCPAPSSSRQKKVFPKAALALGPGREFFWLWPNLAPRDFYRQVFTLL